VHRERRRLLLDQQLGVMLREGMHCLRDRGRQLDMVRPAAPVGRAPLDAMNARRGELQWFEKGVELFERPPAEQRERSTEHVLHPLQGWHDPRRDVNVLRARGDRHQRAVEVEEQGAAFVQQRRGGQLGKFYSAHPSTVTKTAKRSRRQTPHSHVGIRARARQRKRAKARRYTAAFRPPAPSAPPVSRCLLQQTPCCH
jgi:hypothetical protein